MTDQSVNIAYNGNRPEKFKGNFVENSYSFSDL